MWKSVVRGYRRFSSRLAPQHCLICLDALPVIGENETTNKDDITFVKLQCKHKYCSECIRQYVKIKVQSKEVEEDQLVCPHLECKSSVEENDLLLLLGDDAFCQYKAILKRKKNFTDLKDKQDEKNPNARYCPRPECAELILCETEEKYYTCPKCHTLGCFKCGGHAHRFWRCRGALDASYVAWEKSLGKKKAVRACPKCRIRIWKNEGCNHITCTNCRHEYCWVCDSAWDASHYACYEMPFFGSSEYAHQLSRIFGYCFIVLIVVLVCFFGIAYVSLYYLLLRGMIAIIQTFQHALQEATFITNERFRDQDQHLPTPPQPQ